LAQLLTKFPIQLTAMWYATTPQHTTTVLRPFFWNHPGEPVPQENFWTLWCKGRLTEADTPTIRLGATPSGLTTAHLHRPLCSMPVQHKNSSGHEIVNVNFFYETSYI